MQATQNSAKNIVIVTIDGPSGAGKGTLSQMLARALGFHLLDSGALYRLVALAAIKSNADPHNEGVMAKLAEHLDVVFLLEDDKVKVILAGENVTDEIRAEQVGMTASIVAAFPSVRSALLTRQRNFAQAPGLIADGRDMGTTVFPAAHKKIFLTASAEARANRRCKQLAEKGVTANWDEVVRDIRERDDRDINRATSPLRPADDALIVDSTSMSIDEVLNEILGFIAK